MTKAEKFYFAFQRRIDHWRNVAAKDDPYGLATPMMIALEEVRAAIAESGLLDAPDNTLPPGKQVDVDPPRDRHMPRDEGDPFALF